jgi:L-arabinose isomerase
MQGNVTSFTRWGILLAMTLPVLPLRVGLFGIGLEAYWPQFEALKERLEGFVRAVSKKLDRPDVEVINLGLIDSPERAMEAGHRFRREDVDVIFLYVITHALSSTVLSVVEDRDGSILFLVAEGRSVPGPILEIGDTNSRYRFPIGHVTGKIEKLGQLLGICVAHVC